MITHFSNTQAHQVIEPVYLATLLNLSPSLIEPILSQSPEKLLSIIKEIEFSKTTSIILGGIFLTRASVLYFKHDLAIANACNPLPKFYILRSWLQGGAIPDTVPNTMARILAQIGQPRISEYYNILLDLHYSNGKLF